MTQQKEPTTPLQEAAEAALRWFEWWTRNGPTDYPPNLKSSLEIMNDLRAGLLMERAKND
jgi:hypothetical protein